MRKLDVIVVGGGIVGLSSAAHLRREGLSFAVLERAAEIGGTWRDHDYPGCGADTEASTYVPTLEPLFSKRRFASRQELFSYCKGFARKHVGYDNICLDHAVTAAHFSSTDHLWHVETEKGAFEARFVVWANFSGADVGKVKRPAFPDQDMFQGHIAHSSELSSDVEIFKGKKVVILGCGATTVQLAPTIHPVVDHITILSRTTPYIKKTELGHGPRSLWGYRWQGARLRVKNEIISFFDSHPRLEGLYRWPYRFREYFLKRDGMPAAAIPPAKQPVQCTRRAFDYLGFRDVLKKPNVAFLSLRGSSGFERYTEKGLVANGQFIAADVVILATGYHMAEINFDIVVDGRVFKIDPENIRGLYGVIDGLPNSLLAVFGSPLWIIPPRLAEFNTKTFLRLIRHMRAKGLTRADINSTKATKMTNLVQRLNRNHIVLQPDCPSHRYLVSTTAQEAAGELPAKIPANLPFLPFPTVVMEAVTRLTFSIKDFSFGIADRAHIETKTEASFRQPTVERLA
jgi:cation diffusion facilitator CzcD-associated flavoprotein CzcO